MQITRARLVTLILCAAVAAAWAYRVSPAAAGPAAGAQDLIGLDRRISSLEQRLYSIESSISQLRQQAITSQRSGPTQPARDPDAGLLRNQVETLNARVRELECGLVRLDERTLSAAARERRNRAGAAPQDPCRLNPETPVQLSRRP
jgi:hypothetical protein